MRPPLFSALTIFLVPIFGTAQSREYPSYHDPCQPFTCGGINFPFPFSDAATFGTGRFDCGLPRFQVSCDAAGRPVLDLPGTPYQVRTLYLDRQDLAVTVVNAQLIKDLAAGSCESLTNLTVPSSGVKIDNLSLPPQWRFNLTFFKCAAGIALPRELTDSTLVNASCGDAELYLWMNRSSDQSIGSDNSYGGETPDGCRLVEVPVSDVLGLRSSGFMNKSNGERWRFVLDLMGKGFRLVWSAIPECDRCQLRGGRCGFDASLGKVICFGGSRKKPSKTKLIIGCALGSSSLVLIMTLLYIFKTRSLSIQKTSRFGKDETAEERANAEQFLRTYQSTLLTKYSYKDVKKMTHALKERLGKGGYGTVYKGKLPDGRPIAVKILDKSSNNSQMVINEVATIGTIHHVNIIRLLGFCLEGSKQALIYEHMPNGSLGDLLHKEGSKLSLATERLLEIAIGVALGIEYLHKGCASRILHLDIKPHNVLLDENFNPKISDFGLAKIHSRSRSFITMTGARGTIGFIAPEIFMRNNPSHKSDVYSFGMLLLEMVGGRKHEEVRGSASSELYFPGRIYDEINEERAQEFGDLVEEEVAVSRKMVMVGVWCIQINPKDRPSMTQVLEMLMGNLKSIPMPPKPQFFSPPRA
ncbi:rust resistance kinase Lr10 [Eucalyptus grandis]|uniref:rust resistance kinase Lr10 n=1 Tax=Eucalyptus grandis TaxID=71139 RepID=UPI00192EB980|nr:rust resistance kinase Lr10 [Eucalyptus grandis]